MSCKHSDWDEQRQRLKDWKHIKWCLKMSDQFYFANQDAEAMNGEFVLCLCKDIMSI